MRRVSVVGTTGSGKTTVARAMASRLGVRHIELDALSWGPNWTPRPEEEFRRLVAEAARADGWVIDGNYSRVQLPLVWERADTVVWLDYSFLRVMGQLLLRTLRRAVTREPLWHDNRESLRTAFFSPDSILLWALRTYPRRKRQLPARMADPRWAHIRFVRLTSPRAAQAWLSSVTPAAPVGP